jgi:hypothetical protein
MAPSIRATITRSDIRLTWAILPGTKESAENKIGGRFASWHMQNQLKGSSMFESEHAYEVLCGNLTT